MKSSTHTIYFHHDFQSLIVESIAYSIYPVYPDPVSRIRNQSKVNPHTTPPNPQLTFKALGNVVTPLFLIILLRPHPSMKRLASHQAQAFPGLREFSLPTSPPSSSHLSFLAHVKGHPLYKAFPTTQAIWSWGEVGLHHSTLSYIVETYGFTSGLCWRTPWWLKQQHLCPRPIQLITLCPAYPSCAGW